MDDQGERRKEKAKGIDRRQFLGRSAIWAGAAAATMVLGGYGFGQRGLHAPSQAAAQTGVPPWRFGIMADSQWIGADDGKNPNTCAVDIVRQLGRQFIEQRVKFVVHLGDLADKAKDAATMVKSTAGESYQISNLTAEGTLALFVQDLYNAGIGFFPLRGNHDDLATTASEFTRLFPQTQDGHHNVTPADIFNLKNPDHARQPAPERSGQAFSLGSGFSSPSASLQGLSYSFDFANARLIMLDQFTPPDNRAADGSTHSKDRAVAAQQEWITARLAQRAPQSHAFVFSHKGLVTQNHVDGLFGPDPSPASSPGMDAFIESLANHQVGLYFCGHDHMHDRSLVGVSSGQGPAVMQVVGASDSSKFYTPASPANDQKYCDGRRQVPLMQERCTVGYYIVTVDGPLVSVDFHSAPAHPQPDGPKGGPGVEYLITTTPALDFSWRETFGYGLGGKRFLVGAGQELKAVSDKGPGGTAMRILAGKNGNYAMDLSGRPFGLAISTGWRGDADAAGEVLALSGLACELGSRRTDVYVLSLGYDTERVSRSGILSGALALASLDAKEGRWLRAVERNLGGGREFVMGPWRPGYPLGTHGVDTATRSVWAVLNHQGQFAAMAL